jgi:preprotein translocase subunit SecE
MMPVKKLPEKRIDKSSKTQSSGLRKIKSFFVKTGKRLKSFFINMKAELKRVSWPDRKKLIQNTATVLAICVLAGILLYIVDFSLSTILNGIGFYSPSSTTVTTTTASTTAASTTTSTTTSASETTINVTTTAAG